MEVVVESVTITDNRNGQTIEIPIVDGGVSAEEWSKLLPGIWFYDPAFMATACAESSITFIDGDKGILEYRGYPIEQLTKQSTYLEVAYLLLYGELPTAEQLDGWVQEITFHTFIHENMRRRFLEGFHYDAHPMGMLVSAIAALSTYYPDAKNIFDPDVRHKQVIRLIAKMPTLAAAAHRYSVGMPFVYPDSSLDFASNFLSMICKTTEPRYEANPILTRALNALFILHADHEQNCSTAALRVVGSSHVDVYSACAAACAALYGPLHGGANEAVIRMLTDVGSLENVPDFVRSVKEGHGRLQGFGHRVYKHYDPRAEIIRNIAYEVFEVTGKNPLLDIALGLEEVALADEYFVSRKLYPNIDFYSGLIYQAMGFPIEMFPVLFAVPRVAGWLAHWVEMIEHNTKIARPRQLYVGYRRRDYVPMSDR
ncbi:MAG: citrate synthase [Acidimicrobiales bacterium]